MAPSKLKKAIGRVKNQTKIRLATVSGSTSLSDLDVAIVKATNHKEYPADDQYFREIVCITSYSRAYIIACVNTLSKRLNKTKKLDRCAEIFDVDPKAIGRGDPAYEQQFFFSTRRGTRILNLSDFRDATRNDSWVISTFVRSYALYVDERLEYKIQDRRGEKLYKTTSRKRKRPTTRKMPIVFVKIHVLNAYDIFCRQGKQLDELDNFYSWCKTAGIGQIFAYHEIEKITQKKLDLIDELVRYKKSAAQQIEDGLPKAEPEAIEDVNVVKVLLAPEEKVRQGPVEKEAEKGKEGDYSKALFDGGVLAGPLPGSGWESFEDETDWESALVQSGSNFNHQKANLGGGLLMLDGMNQHGQSMKAMASQGSATTGSASSVAFGTARRSAVLVLQSPPSSDGKNMGTSSGGDPFAASFIVTPPTYVQMSDMEKKQRLLEDEVIMLEQHTRNGFQGNAGTWTVQTSPYSRGEHRF
ncbi:Vacuolar iron transporter family protein [Hibiscus syriacus]|uniref:Vacuolar iron transporter family protein n=1 Tax=Hibiscus syriacus TaxID=106335 RepID=A0A6A2ZHK1_HIBSY|nr:Vacuolar iron transporter family protein [Hibiscus syriacus]